MSEKKSRFAKNRAVASPLQNSLYQARRQLSSGYFDYVLVVGECSADVLHEIHHYAGSAKEYFEFIEADADRIEKLREEGYRVVFDNFPALNTCMDYDIIVLQLCEENARAYLEKALDMQRYGGSVVGFMPHAELSWELEQYLLSMGATVENHDPDTLLISVWKPRCTPDSLILGHFQRNNWFEQHLASGDVFSAVVLQYEHEVQTGVRLIREMESLKPGFQQQFNQDGDHPIMVLADKSDYRCVSEISINDFIRQVRKKYWSGLFLLQKITHYFTYDLQNEYRKRVEALVNYDFNMHHIEPIYNAMVAQTRESIDKTIDKLFDRFSQKYNYDERSDRNKHYYNGWKTNKAWYIGEKVIIPLDCYDYRTSTFSALNEIDELRDIERVFDFLDNGTTMSDIDIEAPLREAAKSNQQKDIQLKYFSITVYKKGTCHITFTNLDLLKKFNIFGSRRRGWLPPSYGRKTYEQMDQEERDVVESFEGKEAYQRTMARADYFLKEQTLLPVLPESFELTVEMDK